MPEVREDGKSYYTEDEWSELPIPERHDIEKSMLFKHLGHFSDQVVKSFLDTVNNGDIDGSKFFGTSDDENDCACVLGTLLQFEDAFEDSGRSNNSTEFSVERKVSDVMVPIGANVPDSAASPVERLVFNVTPGCLPDTDVNLGLIRDWTVEYLKGRDT